MEEQPTPEEQQPASKGKSAPETPSEKRGILPGKRVVLPGALYWFMEFLVVFAGVFGAFLLAEYRANREEETQREQITQALFEEIEDITESAKMQGPQIAEMSSELDSLIQAGDTPKLDPMLTSYSSFQPYMWETARATGALTLLDTKMMVRLSDYYSRLNEVNALLNRFYRNAELTIIPNMDAPIEEFYDPADNQLHEKYAWYPSMLRWTSSIVEQAGPMGDSLLAELDPDYATPEDTISSTPDDSLATRP